MDSGIYIRVGANNLLLENIDKETRENWLRGLTRKQLIDTIERLCEVIYLHNFWNGLRDEI